MSSFVVTTSSNRIQLGADRQGRASFTVINTTARSIRGRARIVPSASASPTWFAVDGEVQRQFAPGATEQFAVLVQLPGTELAGEQQFRFDVVGVENPDEDNGQSPLVSVVVAGHAPVPSSSKGYLVSVAGAAAGALVGGLVGTLPGVLVLIGISHQAFTTDPNASVGQAIAQAFFSLLAEALIAVLLIGLGILVGIWLGPVLGVLVALRVRALAYAGWTVGILVVVQPIVIALMTFLFFVIGNTMSKNSGLLIALAAVLAVLIIVLPSLLARGAARLLRAHSL